jgi:selenocysteine lyase/cysteine desulfurase
MLEAGLRQLAAWRPARIGAYCATLTRRLLEQCAALGCEADARESYAEHVVSLELPCESASDRLSAELVRRRIAISRRGRLLRISPHVYNSEADVDVLVAAIASALRHTRR